MVLGADGASIGTKFIASDEAPVSQEYKEAIVKATSEDIVMTEKLSGTPSSIINTAYAKKIGYKQNWFERLLSKNSKTKKYFKMLVQLKGMKKLEKSVKPGNYKNLWIAGKSVEFIDEILPIKEIISIDVQDSPSRLKELSKSCGFSRILIYQGEKQKAHEKKALFVQHQ